LVYIEFGSNYSAPLSNPVLIQKQIPVQKNF